MGRAVRILVTATAAICGGALVPPPPPPPLHQVPHAVGVLRPACAVASSSSSSEFFARTTTTPALSDDDDDDLAATNAAASSSSSSSSSSGVKQQQQRRREGADGPGRRQSGGRQASRKRAGVGQGRRSAPRGGRTRWSAQRRGSDSRIGLAAIKVNQRISRFAESADEILDVFDESGRDFVPVNYATALTWLAKKRPRRGYVEPRSIARICSLAAATRAKVVVEEEEWSARTIGNACWASAKLYSSTWNGRLRGELVRLLEALAARSSRAVDEFNTQELANVAWALGTTGLEAPELAGALAASAVARIADFSPQELANLVWALAKLFGRDIGAPSAKTAAESCSELYRAACAVATRRFDDFKPQELANTVWAVATTGFEPAQSEAFWDAATAAMGRKLRGDRGEMAQPQNVANVAWSVAKVMPGGCSAEARRTFFAIVSRATLDRMDDYNPQELGNIAWSFATARERSDPLFDELATHSRPLLGRFIAQNLANMAWAFATAGRGAPRSRDIGLFLAIADEAMTRLHEFKPQELSNAAWAFATAGVRCSELFDELAAEAGPRLDTFSDQGIVNLLWAFATSDEARRNAQFLDDVAAEIAPRVSRLTPQGLSNVAWSYASADLCAPALFDAIALELLGPGSSPGVSRRCSRLKPQEFSNLAWAFSKVDYRQRPGVFDALAAGMLALSAGRTESGAASGLTAQELANLAWAYACSNRVDPALHKLLWRGIVDKARAANEEDERAQSAHRDKNNASTPEEASTNDRRWGFNLEELRQLHQVVLHARYEAEGSAAIVSDVARAPPAFLSALRQALATLEPSPSRAQEEVAEAVRALGIDVQEELVTADGLSIDVALLPLAERVGIEFDGPYHYFHNANQTETGRTAFKKRLLAACGWTVLHIPYWEWRGLDPSERKDYVKTTLKHLLLEKRRRRTTARRQKNVALADDATTSPSQISPTTATRRPSPAKSSSSHHPDASRPKRRDDDEGYLPSLKVADLRLLCAKRGLDKTVRRSEGDARTVLLRRLRDHAVTTQPGVLDDGGGLGGDDIVGHT
ncbi:hypothetical protein CTAYLR_002478 [Chrysophaeum taylorii]|uniref:RAP domain-containing protein n=1 Tax=Chrysophaeum taylorii TaxID=2483200 RepID=A0AAD7XQZ2_9STRA|nr:hypothetical protein CTAYLR_002478 [Chrysophaeum taylorii]